MQFGSLGRHSTPQRHGIERRGPYRRTVRDDRKTLPKAKFEFFRADGGGERVKYFEIELENVLVGHVEPDLHPGDILAEHVGLKFSKATWRYTQQRIGGGAMGSTVGSWNLATNRTA
jgi:type VI secretion system secreted protein Hcp